VSEKKSRKDNAVNTMGIYTLNGRLEFILPWTVVVSGKAGAVLQPIASLSSKPALPLGVLDLA
jgi:hypothetical protein